MKLMEIPNDIQANLNNNFLLQQIKLCKAVERGNGKLLPISIPKNREEVVYRKNGRSIDKIHEFDFATGAKIKTTHYDYFNDKKVRSIDEFDMETGKLIRKINFILYKSVDEFDIETGKKLRTINYNLKDESKIASIQEYDLEFENVAKIFIYKKNINSVSIIKELNPETGKIVKWTSFRDNGRRNSISEYNSDGKPVKTLYFYEDGVNVRDVHKYNQYGKWASTVRFDRNNHSKTKQICSKSNYQNVKELDDRTKERMAKLIDNLFKKKNIKFENL